MFGLARQAAAILTFDRTGPVQASPRPLGRDSAIEQVVLRLYEAERPCLVRYASSLGLAPHEAEDTVQETFLALFLHLRLGRNEDHLRAWLFRVTHNLTLKRHRARTAAIVTIQTTHTLDSLPANVGTPEEALLTHEHHARTMAIFRALPERDRCCLQLRAEGLRYREIARVLGLSLGSVSTSIARALERFAQSERS